MQVSLIIPAYNEEQRLPTTLVRYAAFLHQRYPGAEFEIVVVANGCRDHTAAVARHCATMIPQIRVIDIPGAIGKGGAVLEGFRAARGRLVAFADADGATAPESLLELLDQAASCDVAIGSRRLAASVITRPQPHARRLLGTLFALSVRALFGMPFRDTQCGAKVFRAPVARQLAAQVQERRWAFDVELLLCARALGCQIVERPVVWADDAGSTLRVGRTATEVLRSLWRLTRRYGLAGHGGVAALQHEGGR